LYSDKVLNLRQILFGHPNLRLCAPASAPESDFNAIMQDDLVPTEDAEIVEGETFVAHSVKDSGESGFTHFLDGAQRHWRAGYLGVLPIRLGHTSAALLQRQGRQIDSPTQQTWRGALEFFLPDGDPELQYKLREAGHSVRTVSATEEESALAIQLKIAKQIEERRKDHELELAAKFMDGRLLIDGGIGEVMRLLDGPFIVGLVKSHQKQYFRSAARHHTILNLKAGERTSVFLRRGTDRQGKNAYSFYIKLHEAPHEPPMFGLARVEMPEQQEYLDRADEIAGWLLHERAPLSLPDRRYAVLLYPIHLVEEHLKARQPSEARIRGIIGL
jgi:hypothetical protein